MCTGSISRYLSCSIALSAHIPRIMINEQWRDICEGFIRLTIASQLLPDHCLKQEHGRTYPISKENHMKDQIITCVRQCFPDMLENKRFFLNRWTNVKYACKRFLFFHYCLYIVKWCPFHIAHNYESFCEPNTNKTLRNLVLYHYKESVQERIKKVKQRTRSLDRFQWLVSQKYKYSSG